MSNDATTLATQSGITLGGSLLGRTLGLIFLLIVTRLVTPDVYGVFVLAVTIVMFVRVHGNRRGRDVSSSQLPAASCH